MLHRCMRAIRRVSIIKTIYFSLKYHARIIIGRGTILQLEKNSTIRCSSGSLRIGMDYNLPRTTILQIKENGYLYVNGNVSFMKGSKIVIEENAVLTMGNRTFINENSRVHCSKKITIGNDCAIAWNVNIIDTDIHKVITDQGQSVTTQEINIGNNVWIGLNSSVLKGVLIGDGSVIGAGSVVTKNVPGNSLSAGNPCRVIKRNISWVG